MTKTSAPSVTRRPVHEAGAGQEPPLSKYAANPGAVTVGLAVTMAWQLAVVVLVPIAGGHALDAHFKTGPVWTIVGLVVAMGGMIIVVRQTLRQLNDYMKPPAADKSKEHDDSNNSN